MTTLGAQNKCVKSDLVSGPVLNFSDREFQPIVRATTRGLQDPAFPYVHTSENLLIFAIYSPSIERCERSRVMPDCFQLQPDPMAITKAVVRLP